MTPEAIKKIAHLARLGLSEQEIVSMGHDLEKIFALIDNMNQLDTDATEPLAHPVGTGQRLRADQITEIDQRQLLMANAPQAEQGLFIVPEVIE